MSKKRSQFYTFQFALGICVICSICLTLVSEGLRPKKEFNEALDVKKNILKAVDLRTPLGEKASNEDIESVYQKYIDVKVIDSSGNVIDGKSPKEIEEGEDAYPIYIYKEGDEKVAYAFPIVGKGLWSTLYGYLALEPDAKTIRGITFYKHGETPGLGAEIEKDWFQDNFKGKSIWDYKDNQLWPVAVIKGKVSEKISDPEQKKHYVDGISGATMTANGVTEMVDREIKKYEPFFAKIRR